MPILHSATEIWWTNVKNIYSECTKARFRNQKNVSNRNFHFPGQRDLIGDLGGAEWLGFGGEDGFVHSDWDFGVRECRIDFAGTVIENRWKTIFSMKSTMTMTRLAGCARKFVETPHLVPSIHSRLSLGPRVSVNNLRKLSSESVFVAQVSVDQGIGAQNQTFP